MKALKISFHKSIVFLLWIIVATRPSYGFDKTFTFDLADFTLINQNGVVQIKPNSRSYNFDTNLSGFPDIPFYEYVYQTGNACNLSSLRYEVLQKSLVTSNVSVKINRPCVPTGIKISILDDIEEADYSVYPDSLIRLYNGPAMNNNRIILSIAPFVYDKETRSLFFVSQIRVMYDEIPANNAVREGNNNENTRDRSDLDYLIITQDSLVDTFKKLRDWKTAKGVKTEIVTLDSINNYCHGSSQTPTPLQIKTFIGDNYTNRNLKMVLLGGSSRIVPVQRCRVQYYNYIDLAASDLFYSCLENGNFAWNAHYDDIIGELVEDNADLTPTISLSRIPLETKEQFSAYIEKLLNYERDPDRDYVTRAMLSGDSLYWHRPDNGLSDAHNNGIDLNSVFLARTLYPDSIYTGLFFDTGNNMGRSGPDSIITAGNIADIIDNYRPHFLNMDTHGEEMAWQFNNNDSLFSTTDALNLANNDAPMIVVTSACYTGDIFGAHPCLGEAFLRHPTGGALAYWGSSKYGFTRSEPDYSMGPSMRMCSSFWEKLPSYYHFGEAVMEAKKCHLNGMNNSHNANDWLLKSMNALGDCEMPIYTEAPKDFTEVYILIDHQNVSIESDESCFLAFVSKEDNGNNIFCAGESSLVSIPSHNNITCSICMTKQNYIPVYAETGHFVLANGIKKLLLQNQHYYNGTIGYEDPDYWKYIYVGNNVDNTAECGDVVVESGATVSFCAIDKIIVESGVRCKKGGRLEFKMYE